jgi:DNA polymerase IV
MPLALNHNPPTIMHVDLNSCFATIEQQANPLLRGKPMVVAAYNSPNGCVVAPSMKPAFSAAAVATQSAALTRATPVYLSRPVCPADGDDGGRVT